MTLEQLENTQSFNPTDTFHKLTFILRGNWSQNVYNILKLILTTFLKKIYSI